MRTFGFDLILIGNPNDQVATASCSAVGCYLDDHDKYPRREPRKQFVQPILDTLGPAHSLTTITPARLPVARFPLDWQNRVTTLGSDDGHDKARLAARPVFRLKEIAPLYEDSPINSTGK